MEMGVAAGLCAVAAVIASIGFLWTRRFQFDSVTVAAIEVGLLFLAGSLALGCVAQHNTTGLWWNWTPLPTAALTCGLLYSGYLILRHAVEEPTQRAVFCAVFSIFAFVDIPIIGWAVDRWCKVHAVGAADVNVLSLAGFLVLAVALGILRFRKEEARRQRDARRRHEHEMV